ncbi:MAG: hypothetical protein LLG04_00775, partial [Parachlamydia sp.]|nr:hypothetical protein [Parachlamydia sp.]
MKLFHKISQFLSSPIGKVWLGEKKHHLRPFLCVIGLNSIAALLEGVSFGFILLAFSALDGSSAAMSNMFGNYAELLQKSMPKDREFLYFTLLAILAQTFRSAFAYLGQIINTFISTNIQVEAQQKVYAQIFRLSFPCISNYKVGDLVEYAKSPAILIRPIMDSVNRILVSSMVSIVSIAMMFFLSPQLALLALSVFGVFGWVLKKIVCKISRISCSLTSHLVEFSKHATQSLQGLRAIFTFDRQVNTLERIRETLGKISHLTQRVGLWNSSIGPINEIMSIALVGAFLIAGQMLFTQTGQEGSIPILLTFITMVYRFGTRIQIIITSIGDIAFHWG